jgi:DNA primase
MTMTHKVFIEQHLDIRSRSGYEWQALCPFHQDSQPSFSINIRKGLFICYACGVKGNMKTLADFFKVKLTGYEPEIQSVIEKLSGITKELKQTERPAVGIKIPERFISSIYGKEYWMQKRNLSDSAIDAYRLGYDDISDEAIIPLADLQGRVLGLIRRRMGNEMPRYMYPRGMKISHSLFGADVAKKEYELFASKKSTYPAVMLEAPPLVIVEGSVDAVAVYETGALGVAILGSRISEHQVQVIKKIAPPHIIVATDRDRAGREAEIQVVSMLKNERMGIPITCAQWDAKDGKDIAELELGKRIQSFSLCKDGHNSQHSAFRISATAMQEIRHRHKFLNQKK